MVVSNDFFPGGGALNGRRWAGKQLLESWAEASAEDPMVLGHTKPKELEQLLPILRNAGLKGPLHGLGLLDPKQFCKWGGLFLPDPSIGRWAQWRLQTTAASFSLIGQIHTLSTPAALSHLQDLVSEPVEPWDAVICSSTAGRSVVQAVMNDRQEQLLRRFGGSLEKALSKRPKLPVIPLPLPVGLMQEKLPDKLQARKELGLPRDAAVVLWLGRLSLFTKFDPWCTYAALQNVALKIDKPLYLIECGPDDTPQQVESFKSLRKLCPKVNFIRLGGANPVQEEIKYQALAASDIGISLVDNPQETFGLAVAEAMAAGIPIIASNWDGYRDLVRNGVDGFLIPTRWASSAENVSISMGWQQLTGISTFPAIAGCLAQLVQIDRAAAEMALITLFTDSSLLRAMGKSAKERAVNKFDNLKVLKKYSNLFMELNELRKSAPNESNKKLSPSIQIDPHRAFSCFSSDPSITSEPVSRDQLLSLPKPIYEGRQQLWELILQSAQEKDHSNLMGDFLKKHK